MRFVILSAVTLMLAGCESPGAKAERAYRDIAGKGDYAAACRAAREAEADFLKEGDGAKALEMKRSADGECGAANMLDSIGRR